ncbi:hypothetical protein Agabi119p4_2108 [Agaricus bisporus var. burnettii]|uniref:Aminoglycoside phosphotransferase domain-containing protein n=1 Tax=Agaricus bisporus var. burnettii TaxID=192524 RepID=A0A8H7KJV2_AGABI|nr:hypothetical protein Agabi119p4_2108 [Agaricus bisporus var. burnettii]
MADIAPKQTGGGYGNIRANIDVDKLNAFLAKNTSVIKAPVDVKQFTFGQSNPTYFLRDVDNARWVLRKKPAGQLLSQTAHQVEREFRVLDALHQHNQNPNTRPDQKVPVPKPILLCEDVSVLGTPFYIMEFLEGRIFIDSRMPDVSSHDRRECWLSAVRSLAALSSIDPASIGLSNFGPPTDYFPRQIKSLSRVSAAQAAAVDVETNEPVGNIPLHDELLNWYRNNLPDESKLGRRIVHGDYKLDNMIFHPTENRVIGILDWELSTLGSPLSDFANFTMPWSIDPKDLPSSATPSTMRAFKNTTEGIPIPIDDLEREYSRLLKQPYPIPELVFARSWNLFRGAIIAQGIAARYARRQATSEHAHLHAKTFHIFGKLAQKVLQDAGITVTSKARL